MKRNYFADKLAVLRVPDFKISLHTYYCGDKVAYKMFLDRKLLFKGVDFKPSALYDWDSEEASFSLLGFLCVQPGDTDSEYFKDYTAAQLEWAESFECEQLKVLLNDVENSENEYYEESIKEFKHKAA